MDTAVKSVAVVVVVEDADVLVVREMIVVGTVVVTGTVTVCVTEDGELVADEVVAVALQVRSYKRMSSLYIAKFFCPAPAYSPQWNSTGSGPSVS